MNLFTGKNGICSPHVDNDDAFSLLAPFNTSKWHFRRKITKIQIKTVEDKMFDHNLQIFKWEDSLMSSFASVIT